MRVQIARRGRPVALLLPCPTADADSHEPGDWVAFSKTWRQIMLDAGLDFVSDVELDDLRTGDLRVPGRRA